MLFVVKCLSVVVCCLLVVVCCCLLLFVVVLRVTFVFCCLMFGVWRSLSDGCCLLFCGCCFEYFVV